MELTEDIISTHKNLSNYRAKFLEFVQKKPESLERWNFRWFKRHDKQVALQPWPTFINRYQKNEHIENLLARGDYLYSRVGFKCIESPPFSYQWGEKGCAVHDMVLGIFIVGNMYAGQWARILPKADSKGIINCAQEAEDSIGFEVEE